MIWSVNDKISQQSDTLVLLIFYDIKRYDIRGRKYLETADKFYMCDVGMRYVILESRNMDYGRVYEKIVYRTSSQRL